MSSLSIIVPWRGDGERFEDTLVSVLQNRPSDCEIVVITAGPYADPYDLAGELTFVSAPRECGLVEQLNRGIDASRGEIVHLLQCGLQVTEGWTASALPHFRDQTVAAVAPVIVDSAGRVVATGVRAGFAGSRTMARSRCDGPTLLAGFWRKSAWERAGGLDAKLNSEFADLDLALALKYLGLRCVVDGNCRLHGAPAPTRISAWSEGRLTETVFHKHLCRTGRRHGYPLHVVGLAVAMAAALPRPRRWPELLARAATFARNLATGQTPSPVRETSSSPAAENDAVRRRDGANLHTDRERRSAPHRNAVQPY